ncbi:hypothetical protein HDV01_007466 [Terramyces sp. JEL0728]|nr:hypothetical protein HDV01_007466 [Terramyces sp. JEL0728]
MDDTVSGPIRLETFEMYPAGNTPEKIVQEFKYLLEKSHRLFITLREPTNTGKNWKPLFQSTFEVYSRLWKFQQVHRKVLENEQYYGMKRWELGELASKIGQLYYYYYLRTSDTSYLQESFTFYSAIQKRKYFEKVLEAKSSALIIKKLRYHIRYIVICLLLNKYQLVHQLSLEFQDYIKKYEFFLEEKDAIEWRLLYNEISSFISAQQLYDVYYEGQLLPITSHLRYSYKTPLNPQIKLEQIVVVGNYENHAKFSGLTLDMYGLLQSLEYDPEFTDSQIPELQSQSGSLETSEPTNINRNPEKHLLFKPTIDLLTLKLATCQKDMTNDQSALLLYLSGEGSQAKQPSGISMASLPSGKSNHDTINTFFPHDLTSFTRKPMFVIVDSDNSMSFKNFQPAFDRPFLCILSPPEMPVTKGEYPFISFNNDGVCRFYELDRISAIRFKETSFCAISTNSRPDIKQTSESEPFPIKQNYFMGDLLVTFVNSRYEIWSYLWRDRSTKYTTIKGTFMDCVSYCAENANCLQYAYFSPPSFRSSGDCYSYESAVGIYNLIPYKGAVSGWIEGRIKCTINGADLECDQIIANISTSAADSTSTFVTSTLLSVATNLLPQLHITQSQTPLTTDEATLESSTFTEPRITVVAATTSAAVLTTHISTLVVTTFVPTNSSTQYTSKYNLSNFTIGSLLLSLILNVVLLVLLAKISQPKETHPERTVSAEGSDFKVSQAPAFNPSLPHQSYDKKITFQESESYSPDNRSSEFQIYQFQNSNDNFPSVLSEDTTQYHKIYLFTTLQNLGAFDYLVDRFLLQFHSNYNLDEEGSLKIRRGDLISILKVTDYAIASNGEKQGRLPLEFIPERSLPVLQLVLIDANGRFSHSDKLLAAIHLYPNLVSIKEIGPSGLDPSDHSDIFDVITGNEKVILYGGCYNDSLYDYIHALTVETWTYIDCTKISRETELKNIEFNHRF